MPVLRIRGIFRLALVASLIGASAACATPAPPSAAPTARPTPVVTPDPHLVAPARADDVYRALNAAGFKVTANNANAGEPGSALIKRINATYLGWPLTIGEYRTVADLDDAAPWASGSTPGQGDTPVSVVGLNILIQWGPSTGAEPDPPNEAQVEALPTLVQALDVLLSPLRGRAVIVVDAPGFSPEPAVSPDASTEPEATPAS